MTAKHPGIVLTPAQAETLFRQMADLLPPGVNMIAAFVGEPNPSNLIGMAAVCSTLPGPITCTILQAITLRQMEKQGRAPKGAAAPFAWDAGKLDS